MSPFISSAVALNQGDFKSSLTAQGFSESCFFKTLQNFLAPSIREIPICSIQKYYGMAIPLNRESALFLIKISTICPIKPSSDCRKNALISSKSFFSIF
jgi:hypothetical protein